ncbi:MAG: phenylalanine--tRNA ligase subunit alpha, partial [Methermicoccaceae archaeon]
LPERRHHNILHEPTPMKEAIRVIDEANIPDISIGWMKRKGWATIENGVLIPHEAPPEGEDEDEQLLKLLEKPTQSVPPNLEQSLRYLEQRGLVEEHESKGFSLSITAQGIKVAENIEFVDDIAQLTPEIIRSMEWKNHPFRRYDINAHARFADMGKIHPYQRLIEEMREIFLSMGFIELKGDVVQSSFWNFDALFQPQDHPAREMQDTFYIKSETDLPSIYPRVKEVHEGKVSYTKGWGGVWSEELARKNVLRTHTTAITIHYLAENPEPPVKAFSIDRVYRREAIDATHTPEFEQLEGVVMAEGMSMKNLFGYLKEFYTHMGFEDVRFRPGYFPYTEPSVEPEVYIDELGWVELGGAGIFREEVTRPLGIKYPVLAWGLGVSRVAMLRLGLKDLRELYQPDIEWLRKEPVFSVQKKRSD